MFEKVRFTMCLGLDTGLYIHKPHLFEGCYNFYQHKDQMLAYKTRDDDGEYLQHPDHVGE
jgi:hypothetical protein